VSTHIISDKLSIPTAFVRIKPMIG